MFKLLFSPYGEVKRLDYFISTLTIQSITLIGLCLSTAYAPALINQLSAGIYSVIFLIFIVLSIFSFTILSIKRIAAIGKNKWLVLILFIPLFGLIFQVALYFIPNQTEGK